MTTDTDVRLRVDHLAKTFGTGAGAHAVIGDLTFHVGAGEIVCIVGPSGVGKTTLLRCLSGLLPATSGVAYLDGEAIDGPPRKLAVVFQEYTRSLMPWLTVEANVLLPIRGTAPKRELTQRARAALEQVGLAGSGSRYPWQLSGGMQQRVAIARALAYRPEVLLMDEPFASVDAQTRFDLEDLVLELRDELGITVVLVTHDIDEAVYLSDRVVVLGRRPCVVIRTIDVGLAMPRDQISTRALPGFAALRTEVFSLVKQAGA
jgi:NitT/TauT family transport system ATP-binding protein